MSDVKVATIPRALVYTCGKCATQMPWDRYGPCACRDTSRPRMAWRGLPLALLLSALPWLLMVAGIVYGVRWLTSQRPPPPVPATAAPADLLAPPTPLPILRGTP